MEGLTVQRSRFRDSVAPRMFRAPWVKTGTRKFAHQLDRGSKHDSHVENAKTADLRKMDNHMQQIIN